MKRIKGSKLPKWIVSKLPFNDEDEIISSFVVPGNIFFLMGIGFLWYKFHTPGWMFIEILVVITLVAIMFLFTWWLLVHVDVLKLCRQELMIRFEFTKDLKEKEEIRKELEKLYVFV